jgi:hypothetical protein
MNVVVDKKKDESDNFVDSKREKKAKAKVSGTRSAMVSSSSEDSSEEEDSPLEPFVEGMRTTNMLFVKYAKAAKVRDIILTEVQLEKYGIKEV